MLQVHKLQLATRQLFEDNKCGPLRGLMLPLIQMPLFISFFFALRGMAAAGLPDFTTGGIAWFTNLSVPDPTYVLPIVSAAATLAVLQVRSSPAYRIDCDRTLISHWCHFRSANTGLLLSKAQ